MCTKQQTHMRERKVKTTATRTMRDVRRDVFLATWAKFGQLKSRRRAVHNIFHLRCGSSCAGSSVRTPGRARQSPLGAHTEPVESPSPASVSDPRVRIRGYVPLRRHRKSRGMGLTAATRR